MNLGTKAATINTHSDLDLTHIPNEEEGTIDIKEEGEEIVDLQENQDQLTTEIEPINNRLNELPLINKKFQCHFCTKLFLYKSGRNRHENLNHLLDNKNIYNCHLCEEITHGLAAFIKHFSKSQPEIVVRGNTKFLFYTCDNCSHYFKTTH